jgi:hypothetical protein
MHLSLAIAMGERAQFAQEADSRGFANDQFSCASVMELFIHFYNFLMKVEEFTKI